ncbi:MAG: PhnD/SsuA/transferrin family substrate-binding protein [Betaproteobacteria bacterium]|nr:PhnD/SsuA/transferrin family substrate-binding protein [Betaproteobacteria bacterium]
MRKSQLAALALCSIAAATTAAAAEALKVSISGEPREEISTADFMDRYGSLAKYIGGAAGTEIRLSYGRDLTRELQRTRSRGSDLMIGPAHVIGSAIRYGYEPVARLSGEERAMFIASAESKVTSFEQARGKRLALPPSDSLATYLARGEFNAKGVQAKSYFSSVREYRFHEAALLALEFGQADVAVADRRLAEEWVARHKGRILLETQPAPMTGVAILSTVDKATKERVRAALLKPNAKTIDTAGFVAKDVRSMQPTVAKEYDYVSTLGYFTPRVLDGVRIVSADEVQALMGKGAVLYDTRSEEEYRDKHIKGARWLPYREKSAKEVGFDFSKDAFDVARAGGKDAPVIFACNGAECWKSYKSCVAARKEGFTQVYWFRGGFPEWVARGLPVESVPASAALTR